MQGTYLIKLRDDSNEADFMRVTGFLQSNKAQIIMASRHGNWFIVVANQQSADVIKKMHIVKCVGGVTFRKREVRIIRSKKHQ